MTCGAAAQLAWKEMPASHPTKNRILLAFACVYLCWGSTYGAIKIAALHLSPPLVGALRSVISVAIICAICLARGASLRVPRSTAWRLTLVGVLLMSANNVLLIWAETKVASGYASLVIAMIPVMVALMETALPDGEKLNLTGWLGTVLGAIGMFALLWPSLHQAVGRNTTGPESHSGSLAGFAILVLAALAFAVGSVLARRFRFQVDTFVATAWQIGSAGLVNLALALAAGSFHTAVWTRSGVLAVAYLSIVGSIVGLTAYTYLLQHVAVTKVSTYAFVNPVIAVLLGVFALHERLAPPEIAGMVLILFAVATVILSRTKPTPPPSDPNITPAMAE
jgi:drug/metabolite transporter (DMT)-like permease